MNKKIGLALGGGGSKGLAHIGVLEVLEENNIQIDFISGTSIGALIGALYAYTKDIKFVKRIALEKDWQRLSLFADFDFKKGLISGKKIEQYLRSIFDGITFKQLEIPLSIMATDINSAKGVVINKGDVVSAIMSSIAAAPVISPMNYKNLILVDGGFSKPVPVEVLKEMGAKFIIAVNLDTNRFKNKIKADEKSILKITSRLSSIVRYNMALESLRSADIVLEPCPEEGSVLRLDRFLRIEEAQKIINQGRLETTKNILKIRKALK